MRAFGIAFISALVLGLPTASGLEERATVRALLRECASPMGASVCLGYISEVANDIAADGLFCPGGPISYDSMIEAFMDWAMLHPERADFSRRTGVMTALTERWPC